MSEQQIDPSWIPVGSPRAYDIVWCDDQDSVLCLMEDGTEIIFSEAYRYHLDVTHVKFK